MQDDNITSTGWTHCRSLLLRRALGLATEATPIRKCAFPAEFFCPPPAIVPDCQLIGVMKFREIFGVCSLNAETNAKTCTCGRPNRGIISDHFRAFPSPSHITTTILTYLLRVHRSSLQESNNELLLLTAFDSPGFCAHYISRTQQRAS